MRAEGATGAGRGGAMQQQPEGPQQGAFSSSRSRSSKAAAGGAGDDLKRADEQLCLPSSASPPPPSACLLLAHPHSANLRVAEHRGGNVGVVWLGGLPAKHSLGEGHGLHQSHCGHRRGGEKSVCVWGDVAGSVRGRTGPEWGGIWHGR
jgi:hypothetical protein